MSRRATPQEWGRRGRELLDAIGEDAVAALVAAFGGRQIRVPSPRTLERLRRRRRVQAALDAGASYRETARAESVVMSTVILDAKHPVPR